MWNDYSQNQMLYTSVTTIETCRSYYTSRCHYLLSSLFSSSSSYLNFKSVPQIPTYSIFLSPLNNNNVLRLRHYDAIRKRYYHHGLIGNGSKNSKGSILMTGQSTESTYSRVSHIRNLSTMNSNNDYTNNNSYFKSFIIRFSKYVRIIRIPIIAFSIYTLGYHRGVVESHRNPYYF